MTKKRQSLIVFVCPDTHAKHAIPRGEHLGDFHTLSEDCRCKPALKESIYIHHELDDHHETTA